MTATHHTEAHRHTHSTTGNTTPIVASQVPSVPRQWPVRAGIALAALTLAVVSFAYGSNDDTSRAPNITSTLSAR
jgi:hypothetical protein